MILSKEAIVLQMIAPNWDSALTGIANAIDLADKFLPKLQSLNCEYFPFCKIVYF